MTASAFPPFRLISDDVRRVAADAVWNAEAGWYCRIAPPTRTLDQNALLHAAFTDIWRSGKGPLPKSGNRKIDIDNLKTYYVSAWMIETGQQSEIVKGMHGEAVQLRRSTASLSKPEFSESMTIIERDCAERGIVLRDKR